MNKLLVGDALYEVIEVSPGKYRVIKNIITRLGQECIIAKHPKAGHVQFHLAEIGNNPYLTYAEAMQAADAKRKEALHAFTHPRPCHNGTGRSAYC